MSKVNRRDLCKLMAVGAGVPAFVGLSQPKKEPEKPKELRAGQIWEDQWGQKRIILQWEHDGPMKGMWAVWSFGERYSGLSWLAPNCIMKFWRYCRTIWNQGGGA